MASSPKSRPCLPGPSYFMKWAKISAWFASSTATPANNRTSHRVSALITDQNLPDMADQEETYFPEEQLEAYCLGGYHPLNLGDTFKRRYKVVRKLGFGQSSTVWLALDLIFDRYVALKVLTADISSGNGSLERVRTLKFIRASDIIHPGRKNIIEVLDCFTHQGPQGIHMCMVLEPMYQDLSVFTQRDPDRKVPLIVVKEITRQLLLALDYLHTSCEITHTDIQAQNILVLVGVGDFDSFIRRFLEETPPSQYGGKNNGLPEYAIASERIPVLLPTDPSYLKFKLAGLGVSVYVDKELPEFIQLPFFRAPEVIIGAKWDNSADIWNLGCVIYELLQGRVLFWGRADEESGLTAEEDHLRQMIEYLGAFPHSLILQGKYSDEYFDELGQLIHAKPTNPFSLEKLIRQWSPNLCEKDILGFESMIRSMLQLYPKDRKSARELLDDPWLQSTPQGRRD